MESIQKLIDDSLKQQNDQAHLQTTWHCSSLGGCLSGAFLKRKGYVEPEFDERTLRVFKMGKLVEDFVEGELEKSGIPFEREVRIEIPEWNLSGRIDIMLDGVPIELKSKHSKTFWYMVGSNRRQGTGPHLHHEMQLWSYLKAVGKKKGKLVYISKDDLAIQEYIVMLDTPRLRELVESEVSILNEAWEKDLCPEPIRDPKDWRYKYCGCHETHCLKQEKYL